MKKYAKIKTISLRRLNNAQYTQFLSEVEKLIAKATPEKLFIESELFDALKQNIQQLTQLAYENRTNSQTQVLVKLDKQRDELVGYLLDVIRVERKSHNAQRKVAATALYQATKNYKGIAQLPYREESLAIKALLADFAKADNMAHLTTLGLSDSVSLLSQVNTDFETQMGDRMQGQATTSVSNAKDIRKQTDEQFDGIALRAQSQNVVAPSSESETFVTHLNKLIDDTLLASKSTTSTSKLQEQTGA